MKTRINGFVFQTNLVFVVVFFVQSAVVVAEDERELKQKIRTAPHRNVRSTLIDGTGTEEIVSRSGDIVDGLDERKIGSNSKVSVSTVAWSTLAMAAATGLGALSFFFVELDPHFDLVQEGQDHGSGNWVVIGILSGGVFIWLCKQFLEQYGEVSMLDIKGADANKVILVIGIMTLHSFGEGSGVGVSFAGSKGLSQGLLVTLAIAVHNIPEGLAVSMVLSSRGYNYILSFICADAFNKFLPFCTGFAAGCMIWMVVAEVLPDAFKEASPSQVASAATISVAFMEALSTLFQSIGQGYNSEVASGFLVSLLFGFGPFLGGVILVGCALVVHLQHALLTGVASGICFILAVWRPSQLLLSSKIGFFPILSLLAMGSAFYHVSTSSVLKIASRKKASINDLATTTKSGISVSALTLQAFLACGAVSLHALAEGLALGVAAPKAYGFGRHMVLPVSLHGLPRGAAVASCVYGATGCWRAALATAGLTGFAGPVSAIGAILAGFNYTRLDYWMVFACGALVPSFGSIFRRGMRLDGKRSGYGLIMGVIFASTCLMSTKLVCMHTPYCNSAPEAVT
ncbi:hypothetical protein ACHQM5_018638 [Ranunculus cassubicifolius]